MPGVVENLSDQVFARGFCYGTRQGGTSQAIGFGALQNIQVRDALQWVDRYGPESLSPIGVGLGQENLTGSFECGVLQPEQLIMALGGNQAYSAGTGYTDYTKHVNDEPLPFQLDCVSDDTPTPTVKCSFFNCLCNDWNVYSATNRQWLSGGGSFRVIGESATGSTKRLFTWSKLGNFANAS